MNNKLDSLITKYDEINEKYNDLCHQIAKLEIEKAITIKEIESEVKKENLVPVKKEDIVPGLKLFNYHQFVLDSTEIELVIVDEVLDVDDEFAVFEADGAEYGIQNMYVLKKEN